MNKASKVILYHVYGVPELFSQVKFSILTLYHHLRGDFTGLQLVVYTDQPEAFNHFAGAMPLHVEHLSPETIRNYKGQYNFVHRVKICVIKACFQKFKSDILYLDSDSYFTEAPHKLLAQISPDTSIMNTNDYDLLEADELFENMDWLAIRRVIRNFSYTIEGEKTKIPLTTRMWNAGVIGLSYRQAGLLDDITDLTDQIYANKHVFTAEQFAFSYFLQNKTRLVSSGDVIFHYWPDFITRYWKRTYNYHFKKFFSAHRKKPVAQQAALAFHLTRQHENLRPPESKRWYRMIRRIKRIAEVTMTGKIRNPD